MASGSYIFYLVHADLGYFCRTNWYNNILPFFLRRHILTEGFLTNEIILMIGIIIVVIGVAVLFDKIIKIGTKSRVKE